MFDTEQCERAWQEVSKDVSMLAAYFADDFWVAGCQTDRTAGVKDLMLRVHDLSNGDMHMRVR